MVAWIRRSGSSLLASIVLVHVALFLTFWLTNRLFYSYVNDYLADLLSLRGDFVSWLLVVSAILGFWSILRLLLNWRNRRHRLWTATSWVFGILGCIYVAFFYGSFWLLLRKSPVQLPRLGQLLGYYRLILDPIILIAAGLLASWAVKKRMQAKGGASVVSRLLRTWPVVVPFLLIWSIMLMCPPASVYRGNLPHKPLVIAHRGASMLAPENTLVALERAADLGVEGVEFDVCISRDGVPFLMHDDDLVRTTNVAEVFPDRVDSRSEDFTLAELTQLNAGDWFVRTDPYGVVASGTVPVDLAERYRDEAIPTLAEALEIVRDRGLLFMFDLKPPPAGHPYGEQFFGLVFDQIHQAGIDPQVWYLVDQEQLGLLRESAPDMVPVYGVDFEEPPQAEALDSDGYQIVNAEYGLSNAWIRNYHAAGLWVNLYTIDEPWQFSRLWILGVESTTTSNAAAMIALSRPILGLAFSTYLVLWIVVGMAGLVAMLAVMLSAPRHRK